MSAAVPIAGLAQSPPPAKSTPPRVVIDTVRIQRENVFDRSEESTNWLARAANRLHIVTRERVIERELLVREGEPFDSATAAESARNLRKLGIFRDVVVDSVRTEAGLAANVNTYDSWSTQPTVSIKTSGDQATWSLGISEKNLLGSQVSLSFKYTSDPDRSTKYFGAKLPRLWKDRLGIGGSYEELSDGKRSRLKMDAPFTSLAGKSSFSMDLQYKDETILQFFEGQEDARDSLRHLLTRATTVLGWAPRASPIGFIRLGTTLQVRREDYSTRQVAEDERSVFGELEVSMEASKSQFSVVRGYRSLGSPEDIDLSRTVRLSLWFAPSWWGYERGGIGPQLKAQVGTVFPKGFFKAGIRASSLFTSNGLDSGSVATALVFALQPTPRQSAVFNVDVGWLKNPYPGEEFDLGLTFGPRGFPAHAFTGDRGFFTTAEYRVVAVPDLFGLLAIGFAGFADYGGAWYNGSPRRTGTDAGVGLRVASIRASSSGGGAIRIDLAHRFANDVLNAGWVVAIGTGLPFDRPR